MTVTTEQKVRAGYAMLIVLFCVMGTICYRSVASLRGHAEAIARTHEVLAASTALGEALATVAAAERGYVVTGQPDFIERHGAAAREVETVFASLRRLVADNPAQERRLEGLQGLIGERMALTARLIELRAHGDTERAAAVMATRVGRSLEARIAGLTDDFHTAERSLLLDRVARSESVERTTKAVIVASGALALAACALALHLLARDFAGRRRAEAALRASRDSLEERVRERTGELARANAALRVGEARLRNIIQSAMDAIITVDDSGTIVLFNAAAESTFRCREEQATGAPLERFIPERFRAAHCVHMRSFAESGVTARAMGKRLALYGRRADGEEFPIDASISQVVAEGRKLYTVILRDVTELRRFERELIEERDTAQRYLDVAGVMLVALDLDGRVTLINRKGCELVGWSEEEIVGRSWFENCVPERDREQTRATFRRLVGREDGPTEFHENAILTRGRGERLIAWHNTILADEAGRVTGTLSSGEDVTERRRAQVELERSHSELRELAAAMHGVREAERTRIARELHDELAQWLTAIKMDLSWLAARLPEDAERLKARAAKTKDAIDAAVGSVRRIAAALRPVMLDDLGLVPSIEHLLHDLSKRAGTAVALDDRTGDIELRDPLATAIYRMIQEALTNVARHARAAKAEVALAVEGGELRIRVADDGIGLAAAPAEGRSFGLAGIRERASTLGGKARIYSPDAGGTVVDIAIPLERNLAGMKRKGAA
ncbi:MAG: PAS domain S-box protein [Burkholderiales bacterium]|nr:PAS domain S-box protein [Burkholderiales bacterium]